MNIEPNKITIEKLLKNVGHNNNWVLPKFQRDSAWNNTQIKELKETINKRGPIGSLTIFNQKGNSLIIDGQQRITSIKELSENKDWYNKNKDYEIPYVMWTGEKNEKNIVGHFINMNNHGSPLDSEDIFLSYISINNFKTPKWFTDHQAFAQLYKTKNKWINAEEYNTIKNISLVQALWYIRHKINNWKNSDRNLIAVVTKKENVNKIKNEIIWIKRILGMLFCSKQSDTDFKFKPEEYEKRLKSKLIEVYETNDSFNLFVKKLNHLFDNFATKFNYIWNVATHKNSMKNKNVFNTRVKNYIAIYMLHFISKNKLAFSNSTNFKNFSKTFDKYKVLGIDLISFIAQNSISAGGKSTWYKYILENDHNLFFSKTKTKSNIEILVNRILEIQNDNKSFTDVQRIILLWLLSDEKLEKPGNKKLYYQFDHIIPYSKNSTKNLVNITSILNCQILSHIDNKAKSNEIGFKYLSWGPMKTINTKPTKQYKEIKKLMKTWEKDSEKLTQSSYEKFLNKRREHLKDILISKLI